MKKRIKIRYKIGGVKLEMDYVRLILIPEEPVKTKDILDPFGIMTDPEKFTNKMRAQALRSSFPESLCITYKEWENRKYNIGDIIYVTIVDE